MKNFRILIIGLFVLLISAGFVSQSQAAGNSDAAASIAAISPSSEGGADASSTPVAEEMAQAKIIKIIAQREIKADDGSKIKQQNLLLHILSGPLAGQNEQYTGISDVQVVNTITYKVGDKVIVNYERDDSGNYIFYITDYVRSDGLLWLLIFFVAIVLAVGRLKGLRALFSFFLSFLFIFYVMVPLFLMGWNAVAIGIIGSTAILMLIIYLTEGYNRKAHIAALGIFFSLIFTAILSAIFVSSNHLTGMTADEITYIIEAVKKPLNYQNLLLASMFIGILGVLDDVVISQVESVLQIKTANPYLKDNKVFEMALKVGQSHLGAIINTLFLAYISTALPLILWISLHQPPFASFFDVVNSEQVATEIVRTLVGVAGLCSAIPISTWLAVKYLRVQPEPRGKDSAV
jgi:uncharacterized membrane protein